MSQRHEKTQKQVIQQLEAELDRLERQIMEQRGDGGKSRRTGDIDMGGYRCRNAGESQQSHDYVTRGEMEAAFSNQLRFKSFLQAGTTFDLDYQAESATSILVFANAGLLQLNDTGKTGYSVNLTGGPGSTTRITTVRTMLATDRILVVYVKKPL